jgi:uncharacterized protein (TIGR00297 family)
MTDPAAFVLFGLALPGAVGLGGGLRAWGRGRPEGSRRVVLAVVVPLVALGDAPAGRTALALAVAAAFGVLALRAGFLDGSGALAAGLLAWGVLALGGWAWAAPGLAFFVLSSLLSRWGRRRKAEAERLAAKPGRRDAGQVFANGGVAGLLLVAHALTGGEGTAEPAFYWGYVGAFAAAAADTWATEVGTFFRWPTRSVRTGRRVEPGTSGGVSLPGTVAAVLGAAAVSASALPFAGPYLEGLRPGVVALVVVAAGVAGAALDSLLGATVQVRYRAPDGVLTERPSEGGVVLPLAAGVRGVTNDVVNLACTALGAAIPLLVLR